MNENKKPGWSGGSAQSDHVECLRVLDRFVEELDEDGCARLEWCKASWPELARIYDSALKLVR